MLKAKSIIHTPSPSKETKLSDPHAEIAKLTKKLKNVETELKQTEEFSKVGRWKFVFDDMEWSSGTYKIFDCPENYEGKIKDYYLSCLDKDTAFRLKEQDDLLKVNSLDTVINQTIITPAGNKKLLSFSSEPILDENGETIGAKGVVKDISDEILGEKGLKNFFDLSLDLHCIVHRDYYLIKISPSWMEVLGYTEEEILSRSYLELIHPDDVQATLAVIEEMDGSGRAIAFQNRYLTKTGEIVYLSWNAQIDSENQLAYCSARNITKSKIAQDALMNDLDEKNLLLREIHHRVKNNLQIISSLLSLQSGANSHERHLVKLYQESQNRIQSMASIHEMFYQSEELDQIDFGNYLNKLVGDLRNSFSAKNVQISFSMNLDPMQVCLDNAVPLGLLINEVITNAIKHGGDEKGVVDVLISLKSLAEGKYQFIIGDKGVNAKPDILNSSNESLGVLLINSLVEQLDGEIEQLNSAVGTVYKLSFTKAE